MGISGLLPLLKSIQVNRSLSDLSGQTLAVDAYVWLHRGAYACAPDLVTGKPTQKYVDYAMHRVRLLRHHNIEPYVVFDGGPLPAKKGTEVGRKQRRDENLARANALARQGRSNQARDFYVKCVDITPQMAFQLIKALRAESVPYVVAPYEADAQLAYLERVGLVNGIITEDSDLLVFGCRNVFFKLDANTSTVTCIPREKFASVSGDISFKGWSDAQFRSMAILSGCDYLPSIPGVGLKTAWSLLRKHRTVENVVRAIRLEGKKPVPRDYLEQYALTEKVFLYQRVYDPRTEKLVHLTDIPDGEALDEVQEAYVGSDREPALAKRIAEGDNDPISLLPMVDINPGFTPRVRKAPLVTNDLNRTSLNNKGKGKAKASGGPPSGGILSFFGPNPIIPRPAKSLSQPTKLSVVAGKASGKRTLGDVMDHDLAVKRKRHEEVDIAYTESRFFGAETPKNLGESTPIAGPSHLVQDKENLRSPAQEDDEDVPFAHEGVPDPVTQEDGYLSLSPSSSRFATPDLSSPLRPTRRGLSQQSRGSQDDDFGADSISSPPTIKVPPRHSGSHKKPSRPQQVFALAQNTPVPPVEETGFIGPDLRDCFGDDQTSEIDCSDDDESPTISFTPSPVTPDDTGQNGNDVIKALVDGDLDTDFDDEKERKKDNALRNQTVANGWWDKWARNITAKEEDHRFRPRSTLRRQDTAVTPAGRHSARNNRPSSAREKSHAKVPLERKHLSARRSLIPFEEIKTPTRTGRPVKLRCESSSSSVDDITTVTQGRLAQFRCP